MIKKDWNPDAYLTFDRERIQPSIDLVSRIAIENPRTIIDVGCGPGNSTQILSQRWPEGEITGIDNSPNMIERATRDFPNQNWILLDAGRDAIPGTYDIVFSNAAIQWIPNHFQLFEKFKAILSDNGILAVQLPLLFDMPLGQSIARISREDPWSIATRDANDQFTIHTISDYYDFLSPLFSSVEIWTSDYFHVMDSADAILEMIRSTGLRPYLDRLQNETEKRGFEQRVLADIKRTYPSQKNGKVLFPFKRLFFVGKK